MRTYAIELLSGSHDREAFSCGVEALDGYLRRQAGQDMRKRAAAVFVAVEVSTGSIAGYYTLSSTAIDAGSLPVSVTRKLPKYPSIPATLLGRLAVSLDHQGEKLGRDLLGDALHRVIEHSREIASTALVVDAKDERARRFYLKHGFIPFDDIANRLFLMLDSATRLI